MNFSFWPFLWFGLPGRLQIVAGFFLIFVAQKNHPGESLAKSSKVYTTKIPDTFLQRGRAIMFVVCCVDCIVPGLESAYSLGLRRGNLREKARASKPLPGGISLSECGLRLVPSAGLEGK